MKKRRLNPKNSAAVMVVFLTGAALAITVAAFAELSVTTVMDVISTELGGFRFYPMAFAMAACGQLISTALAGAWCDARSPKYSLITGGIAFGIGVVLCGLAPNMWFFIAGRFATGIGAGFLMVPVYVLVSSLIPKRRQPLAFAVFAGAWVIPSLIGPSLAGWLVEHISWRWIFAFIIIAVVPVALLIASLLQYIEDRHCATSTRVRRTAASATVAGIAIVIIQFATIESRWWTWGVTIVAVIAVLVSIHFLFPAGTLILKRGLPAVIAARGLANAAYMVIITNLPVALVRVHGWSPKSAGIAVTAGAVTYALGSLVQSQFKQDFLRRRLPLYGGTLIAVGTCISGIVAFSWGSAQVAIVGWSIAGLGIGMAYSSLPVLAFAEVSSARHGEVSSDLQLSDSVGAAIALGIVTGLFSALSTAPGAWPYLPAPLIAFGFGLLAILAGYRIVR